MVYRQRHESQSLKILNNVSRTKRYELLCLDINGHFIPASNHVKLLGVNIDNSLNVEAPIKEQCRKVKKVHVFVRLGPFLGEQKLKLIFDSVIMSNFLYCPLKQHTKITYQCS